MTLFPRLDGHDQRPVLEVGARSASARDLWAAVASLQAQLEALEIPPGSHIGVWTQPSLETLVSLVAVAASGSVLVPLDPKLGPLELGHVLRDAAPRLALASDPSTVPAHAAVQTIAPTLDGGHEPRLREVDDSPLLVLYTSGTTGLPKGAVLSARNVAFDLDALAQVWGWSSADTVVHALPMFHVHGLVLGLFGSLRHGKGLRWFPRFEPAPVAAALREGPSLLFAVPTMYHRLSEAAETDAAIVEGLRAARVLVSGSAALPQRDQQRIEALTGGRVIERYGLTETIINCAVSAGTMDGGGTVGPPLPGVELRLVDDQRRTLEARDESTLGEIAVRGPNVFLGYLNRPDATAAVKDADGWFFTGDLATIRADGSVRIVGRRATDLIKCGGFKVGAGEVEAALLEHPLVREAAVVGRPDPDLGERIVAFVVLAEPCEPKHLETFVAGLLSPHKRPREVHAVDSLPRNAMGKVVKPRLP